LSQELELNKQAMCFKLDTGAAVTAIPKSVYSESRDGLLKASEKNPNKSPLKVIGTFVAVIKKKGEGNRTGSVCDIRFSHAIVGSSSHSKASINTASC